MNEWVKADGDPIPSDWETPGLPVDGQWTNACVCESFNRPENSTVDTITIKGKPGTITSVENGKAKWALVLNDTPDDFRIDRFSDDGTILDSPLTISRADGEATFHDPVMLSRDPVEDMEAATKAYADSKGGIPDAPAINWYFGRFNNAWATIPIQSDAPSDGQSYIRKDNGWSLAFDGSGYLPLTGGTITGSLTVNQVLTVQGSNSLVLNAPVTGGSQRAILGQAANITRWQLMLGDGTAEGANNAGANFSLSAYGVAGAFLGNWLTVSRADGSTVFNGSGVTIQGGLAVNGLLALASPNNLAIYGGSAGQVLTTNGSGILTWTTPSGGGGPSGPPVTIGDTPPSSPAVGALWWDSVGGQLYVWYSDANSSQWVVANSGGGGGGGSGPSPSTTLPLMSGTAAVGTGTTYARADHVHPTDTSRAAASDLAGYLPLSGGTMTGNSPLIAPWLMVTTSNNYIDVQQNISARIYARKAGLNRWILDLGTSFPSESGSNSGSDFALLACADNGGSLSTPLTISRATGQATFSSSLTVATAGGAQLALQKAAGANASSVFGYVGTSPRWGIQLGDSTAESGSNAGSNLAINRYTDAGAIIDSPLTIARATGNATFSANLTVSAGLGVSGGATVTGNLVSNTGVFSRSNVTAAFVLGRASDGQTRAQFYQGTDNQAVVQNSLATGTPYMTIGNGAANASLFSSTTVYKPGGGAFTDSSDERIKNIVGDYDVGLDEVLQLRPVVYTFKGNDTTTDDVSREVGDHSPQVKALESAPYPASPHYNDAVAGTEFVGFVAQEVEQVFPDMVGQREGYIDGEKVADLRDVDTTRLIFALVNAVKTLTARVSELEAARGA